MRALLLAVAVLLASSCKHTPVVEPDPDDMRPTGALKDSDIREEQRRDRQEVAAEQLREDQANADVLRVLSHLVDAGQ